MVANTARAPIAISAATMTFAALLAFTTAVDAHNADRVQPSRQVLETRTAQLRGSGAVFISVTGVLNNLDGLFDDVVAEVIRDGASVQRIALAEFMNTSPRRGDWLIDVVDMDHDGNDDLWITVDAAVDNHTMRVFLYDARRRKFVPDRDFINPVSDPKSGCVREHISNGAAGWRGKASVWCRVGGQWVKRFQRSQDDTKQPGQTFTAIQADYTVSPLRIERFDLMADNNGLAWDQRLPAWVAQLETRAALARQRRAVK
jgi:hypothetical protein